MSTTILKVCCQKYDCNNRDLKQWICGRCNKGNLYVSENGIVTCNNCDFREDILSIDFICKKCKEKNNNSIYLSNKIQSFVYSFDKLVDENEISDNFCFNLIKSIMMQRHKYKN